ncbi:hypothetical protein BBJ28_00002287 [Nothophytophthora sp. Chile5]|nr:hypothetical protein BBJ28_00002287 [Nothophytophthora sp. Chile5]
MLRASRLVGAAHRAMGPGAHASLRLEALPVARVRFFAQQPRAAGLYGSHTSFLTALAQRQPIGSRAETARLWMRLRASTSGADAASKSEELATESMTHMERLKDLWRKYGVVAIGTYLTLYGAVLGSIYVGISQGWVRTSKRSRSAGDGTKAATQDEDFNLVTTTNKCVGRLFVTFAENLGIAQYLEVEHVSSKSGTFLLAWIATKFTEPLRLAVTLAVTPRIARFVGRAPKLPPKLPLKLKKQPQTPQQQQSKV